MSKKQESVEEIVGSLQSVGEDISQIGKLVLEEKALVKQFFDTLKSMQLLEGSIVVSTSALPVGLRRSGVAQACVDSTALLMLTFIDGHREIRDLNQTEDFDLTASVACDIAPKFEGLVVEMVKKIRSQPAFEEHPKVQDPTAPALKPELPVFVAPPVAEEAPPITLEKALTSPPTAEPPPEQPAPAPPPLPLEYGAEIAAVTEETLGYLKELGTEVFEHLPVSTYFDDWMVNLRQVILSFESSEVIGTDDTFTNDCARIFTDIEDELARRLMTEVQIEASMKTLTENRELLGQLDSGYAAVAKELVVRGKSALDFLINNVNHLKKELAEIENIKTSYLHPLKRIARDQRRTEVIEKLNGAKKRLALAVQNSAVAQMGADKGSGELDAQSSDLGDKRKIALGFFTKEIGDLKEEIAKLEKIRATTFNPIRKVALEQKIWEINQNLTTAKNRLELAEQNSATGACEQARLYDDYEKKKQAAIGTVETLEKEIARSEEDKSIETRRAAAEALAYAVKARVQRKTAPIPPDSTERA